jgi:hypothetical protein
MVKICFEISEQTNELLNKFRAGDSNDDQFINELVECAYCWVQTD